MEVKEHVYRRKNYHVLLNHNQIKPKGGKECSKNSPKIIRPHSTPKVFIACGLDGLTGFVSVSFGLLILDRIDVYNLNDLSRHNDLVFMVALSLILGPLSMQVAGAYRSTFRYFDRYVLTVVGKGLGIFAMLLIAINAVMGAVTLAFVQIAFFFFCLSS